MEEPYLEEKYNPCIMKDGNFSKPFERSSRTNSYGVKVQKLIPTQFHKSPLKMLQKNPEAQSQLQQGVISLAKITISLIIA